MKYYHNYVGPWPCPYRPSVSLSQTQCVSLSAVTAVANIRDDDHDRTAKECQHNQCHCGVWCHYEYLSLLLSSVTVSSESTAAVQIQLPTFVMIFIFLYEVLGPGREDLSGQW